MKRNNRRHARAIKEEVEAQGAQERESIKKLVQQAKDEGFPTDLEEKEGYFMGQVAKGESLCAEGMLLPSAEPTLGPTLVSISAIHIPT